MKVTCGAFIKTWADLTLLDAINAATPALRRYARGLLGSVQDADDLVHDALIDALTKLKPDLDYDDVKPWLFTILRNRFISDRRRAKHRSTIPLDDAVCAMPTTKPHQEAGLQMRDLNLGLAALPVEQREILLLITVEGFTYAEAAAMLDIPIGTVMSRLSRARDRLNDFMDGRARPLLRSVR
jgi:RNA polymerase sigma factor (sigma-70 family)